MSVWPAAMSTVVRPELPAPAQPRRQSRSAFTVLGSEPEAAEDFADRVIAWQTPRRKPQTVKHFFTGLNHITGKLKVVLNRMF